MVHGNSSWMGQLHSLWKDFHLKTVLRGQNCIIAELTTASDEANSVNSEQHMELHYLKALIKCS